MFGLIGYKHDPKLDNILSTLSKLYVHMCIYVCRNI